MGRKKLVKKVGGAVGCCLYTILCLLPISFSIGVYFLSQVGRRSGRITEFNDAVSIWDSGGYREVNRVVDASVQLLGAFDNTTTLEISTDMTSLTQTELSELRMDDDIAPIASWDPYFLSGEVSDIETDDNIWWATSLAIQFDLSVNRSDSGFDLLEPLSSVSFVLLLFSEAGNSYSEEQEYYGLHTACFVFDYDDAATLGDSWMPESCFSTHRYSSTVVGPSESVDFTIELRSPNDPEVVLDRLTRGTRSFGLPISVTVSVGVAGLVLSCVVCGAFLCLGVLVIVVLCVVKPFGRFRRSNLVRSPAMAVAMAVGQQPVPMQPVPMQPVYPMQMEVPPYAPGFVQQPMQPALSPVVYAPVAPSFVSGGQMPAVHSQAGPIPSQEQLFSGAGASQFPSVSTMS